MKRESGFWVFGLLSLASIIAALVLLFVKEYLLSIVSAIAFVLFLIITLSKYNAEKDDEAWNVLTNAFKHIFDCKFGSKNDFTNLFGESLYNQFLEDGVLHEPLDYVAKNDSRWEITKYGLNVAENFLESCNE